MARVDLDGNVIKSMTICMIGARGFIGSHLCKKLMHLLELNSLPWNGCIEFHRLNIKNDSRLEGLIKCSGLVIYLCW
ncbi:putative NAD-dependent epimerase/dehydratase, NAD(P)-binding domain superfamily [Helianthus anomalus]